MKDLLQEIETKLFYKGKSEWTHIRDEAKVFVSAEAALKESTRENLHARIVLAFPNPEYDICLTYGRE